MRPRRFKARKTGEAEKIKDVIECHFEVWYYYIVKKRESREHPALFSYTQIERSEENARKKNRAKRRGVRKVRMAYARERGPRLLHFSEMY